MITAVLIGMCGFVHQDRASDVLRALAEALGAKRTILATVVGETASNGVPILQTAHLVLSRDPFRYWCKDTTTAGDEYASFEGKKMTYTDDRGLRQEGDVPSPRVLVNNASLIGLAAWDALCDIGKYQTGVDGHSLYLNSEEVDGHMCDLIEVVRSGKDITVGHLPITTSSYVWVDQATHLPRAFQTLRFWRGRSTLTDKWTVTEIGTDQAFEDKPLPSIPTKVSRMTVSAPAGGAASVPGWKRGDACPSFPLQTLDGRSVSLPSLVKGRTLITFWASWCAPCKAELEALAKFPDVKSGKLNVVAIGVSDSKQNLRGFADKGNPLFHFYLDPDAERSTSPIRKLFADGSIPRAYLFNANGKLIRNWLGFEDAKSLAKELVSN